MVRTSTLSFALAVAALLYAAPVAAQWQQVFTAGPDETVTTFASTPGRMYIATQEVPVGARLLASPNGAAWTQLDVPFVPVSYVEAIYAEGDTVVVSTSGAGTVLRTDDAGLSWREWDAGLPPNGTVRDFAATERVFGTRLFAVISDEVYRSDLDLSSDRWMQHTFGFPDAAAGNRAIGVRDEAVFVSVTGDPQFNPVSGIYRSSVEGSAWNRVDGVFSTTDFILDLAVTPGGVVAVSASEAFATSDGASWAPVPDLADLGFQVELVGFADGALAVTGTDVLFSADGLSGWVDITDGLPNGVQWRSATVFDGSVYVSSSGSPSSRVWRRPLSSVVAGGDAPRADAFTLAAPAPNPTRGQAALALVLPAPARIVVEVLSADGRRMRRTSPTAPAGPSRVEVDTAGFAAGVYAVRVRVGDAERTAFVTVTR